MLEYLQDLLKDLEEFREAGEQQEFTNYYQKVFALETSIEILTKLKNNERSVENGNIK